MHYRKITRYLILTIGDFTLVIKLQRSLSDTEKLCFTTTKQRVMLLYNTGRCACQNINWESKEYLQICRGRRPWYVGKSNHSHGCDNLAMNATSCVGSQRIIAKDSSYYLQPEAWQRENNVTQLSNLIH